MPCVAILKRNGVKMPRNLAGIVGNALRCVLCRITELIDCHAVLQFSRVLATSHSRYLVNVREKLGFMPQSIQWSAVTVTPSGIGKIVTVTDCHSNSSFLSALK